MSLFCELEISSQDQVDLRRKKRKHIFSRTVPASKLTWQGTLHCRSTTLTSIVAAVDSICKKRQKNCLIHGELTEANKALCFFSERGVI